MKRYAIAILCLTTAVYAPLMADYSSLTQAERDALRATLSMSWEYRALIDGKDTGRIVEAVEIEPGKWRVQVAIDIPKQDGSVRTIERPVYLTLKTTGGSGGGTGWLAPGLAGLAAGILIGFLAAK